MTQIDYSVQFTSKIQICYTTTSVKIFVEIAGPDIKDPVVGGPWVYIRDISVLGGKYTVGPTLRD